MRRPAIDTNIYVAFKNNAADVVEVFRICDVIGVDIAVIAELYAGFSLGNKGSERTDGNWKHFSMRPEWRRSCMTWRPQNITR